MKISRVYSNHTKFAIYEYCNQGFSFGQTFYMNDQKIYFNYNGYYVGNAINSDMNICFIPEEIEVFEIKSF